MSDQMLASLDLEDLTARQLRKLLNGIARSRLPYAKKTREEQDEDLEKATEEREAQADLHKEKKGDGKLPKVLKSDLPATAGNAKKDDDDEDEDDDDEGTQKPTKNRKLV